MTKIKLIRITTIGISINKLLEGQLSFLSDHYDIVAISRKDQDLIKAARRENIMFRTVPFVRSISFFKDLWCFYLLLISFKQEKPIIIHTNTPKASLLSLAAGYMMNVPIRIYSVTGLRYQGATGMKKKLLIGFEKLTCLFATNIYPEGKGVKNDLIKDQITKKPLKVIANGNINGINISHFSKKHFNKSQLKQKRKEHSVGENDFIFLFVGRIVKDKGIVELVKAFTEVQKKNSNCTLLLVGPFEEDLDPLPKQTFITIKTHQKIITTGYQDDVRIFYAMSDALVFPSYREGFPNVVMQAGAMGLPAIVSDINGCNEIIIHEFNGLIIPPKNTHALQQAMLRLLTSTSLRDHLSSNARSNVKSKYQQETVWQALLAEYRRLEAKL